MNNEANLKENKMTKITPEFEAYLATIPALNAAAAIERKRNGYIMAFLGLAFLVSASTLIFRLA